MTSTETESISTVRRDSLPRTGTVAIVNPGAASGGTAALFKNLLPYLPAGICVKYTQRGGNAADLAREALAEGFQTIVAVGGDGTIHNVVNGLVDANGAVPPDLRLAIIPSGTGADFPRTLRIPSNPIEAALLLQHGKSVRMDLLRVRYQSVNGQPTVRYCVNVTSFGMGGEVAGRANRSSKALGGRATFLLATTLTALRFAGIDVEVVLDGRVVFSGRISNVAVGNGQYHGGGMRICPEARLDDGRMDITTVDYMNPLELLLKLPHLYNGRLFKLNEVKSFNAIRLQATAKSPAAIEIDGEPVGRLPIEISVMPRVLQVLVP